MILSKRDSGSRETREGLPIRHLFQLNRGSDYSLQKQIVEQIVAAIAGGHIPLDTPLPSSRSLADQLEVARNTVTLAYNRLRDDGYLISKERSGYFVNPEAVQAARLLAAGGPSHTVKTADWDTKLLIRPTLQRNIVKPQDWQAYMYPFICGQLDLDLFPVNHWRECCRDAMSVGAIRSWANDRVDADDALLLEQIHQHLLPARGIWAEPDQILITVGAQQALYMITRLLLDETKVLGLEDPGYVDMRNIAEVNRISVRALPVDERGLVISDAIDGCDCVYVTPSHQSPTTVTLPLERRRSLLGRARSSDFFIIEDDYESEMAYGCNPTPALKSLDRDGRVLYVGSLSKTLAPGLRLGYVVASASLIRELRALRRLILRHPPANNQRSVALFLARGYHESLVKILRQVYQERCETMRLALKTYLPGSARVPTFGGSSYWVDGPDGLQDTELQKRAAAAGILIEAGHIHFLSNNPPLNHFRLGFSSIPKEKIGPGVERLARIVREMY